MSRHRAPAGVLVLVLGLLAAVAGCTTVPTSSTPSIVRAVPQGDAGQAVTVTPPPGADPRTIVQGFLQASAVNDPNHASARSFLTPEANRRWLDTTITVIDQPQIGNPVDGKVTVTGQQIGSVDSSGVYTPSLQGDGTGTRGTPVSQTFDFAKVHGQWRIDSLQKGLLLSVGQFEQQYQQRKVYFFDISEEHLVPDPRYTALVDTRDLVTWLVAQLAQGPRGGLQTGVPAQADAKRVRVVSFPAGEAPAPIQIEIPGSGQLDISNRDRLAAQVATTLGQVDPSGDMQITDGGQPVRIPAVGGTRFTLQDLAGQYSISRPSPQLFYVRGGAVYQGDGRRLPGRVGAGVYGLTSVALSPTIGGTDLRVAGVRGSGNDEYLDIGTPDRLIATRLHGALSRPAWAPDVDEVWVGDGSTLYRVGLNGAVTPVPIDSVGGRPSGTVVAVRLSPEGSRVALVLRNSDNIAQIYIGAVVRGTSQVRVAGLVPISPQGVAINDVAWNDELKLFAIGTDTATGNWGVYEVQCDGSLWTLRSDSGLPGTPESLTVTAHAVAAVSVGNTVWRQQAGGWAALRGDDTVGRNPVYLE